MSERAEVERGVREACDAQRWRDAATLAIEGFGPEIVSYLTAVTRSEADAAEVFSEFSEQLWNGLPRFRWESTLRTWAYTIARHAWGHFARDVNRRGGRRVPLSDPAVEAIAQQVHSRTQTFLRTAKRDRLAELRDALSDDDRTLLILRIDRQLPWRDIALVMGGPDDASPDAVTRRSASLRKRFERIKDDLRVKLRGG